MAKRKGFKFKKKIETMAVTFDGGPLEGLELTVQQRVPIGLLMSIGNADNAETVRLFAKQLVDWNVEDDEGNPVPLTLKAVGEHIDVEDIRLIIDAWTEAMTSPRAPLETPPSDGGDSEGDSTSEPESPSKSPQDSRGPK